MNLEILGKKLGMSQVYDENNVLVPVTIIEAGPCPILQVKSVTVTDIKLSKLGLILTVSLQINQTNVLLDMPKKLVLKLNRSPKK